LGFSGFWFSHLTPQVPPRSTLHFEISGEGLNSGVVASRARFRILVLQDGPVGPPGCIAGGGFFCFFFFFVYFIFIFYFLFFILFFIFYFYFYFYFYFLQFFF
jgi:hypothetical protein